MCFFLSKKKVYVSNTRQFIYRINPNQQFFVYDNRYARVHTKNSTDFGAFGQTSENSIGLGFTFGQASEKDEKDSFSLGIKDSETKDTDVDDNLLVMILALPGKAEDIILEPAWQNIAEKILDDCNEVFEPKQSSRGFSFSFGGDTTLSAKLPVQQVGSYMCTIVPDHTWFKQVDTTQLPIPEHALEALQKEYKSGNPFLVAKTRLTADGKIKPLVGVCGVDANKVALCPAIHFHDNHTELLDQEPHWDHTIYVAGIEKVEAHIVRQSTGQKQPLFVKSAIGFSGTETKMPNHLLQLLQDNHIPLGWVNPVKGFMFGGDQPSSVPLARIEVHGMALNGDIHIQGKLYQLSSVVRPVFASSSSITVHSSNTSVPMTPFTTSSTNTITSSSTSIYTDTIPMGPFRPTTTTTTTSIMESSSNSFSTPSSELLDCWCDACGETIPQRHGRYRCTMCLDLDMCMGCFDKHKWYMNGKQFKKSSPQHTIQHPMAFLPFGKNRMIYRFSVNKTKWTHQDTRMICTSCNQEAIGYRYLCTTTGCHARLCEECDQRTDRHNPTHSVLRQSPI